MNLIRVLMLTLILSLPAVCVSGCKSTTAVLVPGGVPIRLAEPVEAYIYVPVSGKWVKSDARCTIPAGWWCVDSPDGVGD